MAPMRGTLLGALLIFLFTSAAHAASQKLPASVVAALQQAQIPVSHVGIFVQSVSAKKPLIEHGVDQAMNPASTMKLVTTYAGLELLGPAYTWKTEVYADGALQGDVLQGNLIFKGYGDPKLTLEDFWLLLRDLRQRGLREIRGDLVLDRRFFAPIVHDPAAFDSQPQRAYNVPPDALLLNFKSIRLRLLATPQTNAVRVIANPAPVQLELINAVRLVQDQPCGDWREDLTANPEIKAGVVRLTVSGQYAQSCGEQDWYLGLLASNDYFYGVFKQLWQEQGGSLQGGVREGQASQSAQFLAKLESAPLADIIRDINKFSNNVMARQLFLTLGAQYNSQPGSSDSAALAIKSWLHRKGLDFPELVLENGAGLSRIERVSPRHLGEMLIAAFNSPTFAELESSLPIVSVDGTMKKRLNQHRIAGHAHIKTGTLDGVKTLAGYVFDKQGRRIVVVCMINHPNAAAGQAAQDALLEWIYDRR